MSDEPHLYLRARVSKHEIIAALEELIINQDANPDPGWWTARDAHILETAARMIRGAHSRATRA